MLAALSEAYPDDALRAVIQANPSRVKSGATGKAGDTGSQGDSPWPDAIYDLGEGRIAAMDEAGVDVQILSSVPRH